MSNTKINTKKLSKISSLLDREIFKLEQIRLEISLNRTNINSAKKQAYDNGYIDGYTDKENNYKGRINTINRTNESD